MDYNMNFNEQRKLALKIFKGDKFIDLRKAIKEGKCLNELVKIADEKEAIKLWDFFYDEWKCYTSEHWKGITNEMRIKEFPNLDDEWKCYASEYWNGISDAMRKKHSMSLLMNGNI